MKAEIFTLRKWVSNTNSKQLFDCLNDLLEKSEFEILNFIEHHFSEQGYTCLWLIGESHLAVHTFPEENKTYIELSSCNKQKNELFAVLLNEKLKSK